MDLRTRATLEQWRKDIADEIEIATAELSASEAALRQAEEAEAEEKTRVANLTAAFGRFGSEVQISNALRSRFTAARQFSPTSCCRGHAGAVSAAEFKLTDLHEAIAQIDLLLRPPAPPALALVDARQAAAAKAGDFVQIVATPARVA